MRIGLISTLTRTVPPVGEGSVESLVSLLAERLVARGHEVTLYALAGSKTSARLRSPVETSYVTDPGKWDWQLYEAYQVREAFRDWKQFDVIHCHSYHFGLLFSDFVDIPTVHSIHVEPGPDLRFLAQRCGNRHVVMASKFQARDFLDLDHIHVIPHGIDPAEFQIAAPTERDDYLAFLGRFHPDKGPLEAIEVAKQAGCRLKMAAPSNDYFREVIQPLVDGDRVQYVGEVHGAAKSEFLSRAKALVYPVKRGEPFGLVLVEAMACGLPVLALAEGAVPEIVENGVSGFVSNSIQEIAEAVTKLDNLDRATIRQAAVNQFSADTMTDRFEKLYREAVDSSRSATGHGSLSPTSARL